MRSGGSPDSQFRADLEEELNRREAEVRLLLGGVTAETPNAAARVALREALRCTEGERRALDRAAEFNRRRREALRRSMELGER